MTLVNVKQSVKMMMLLYACLLAVQYERSKANSYNRLLLAGVLGELLILVTSSILIRMHYDMIKSYMRISRCRLCYIVSFNLFHCVVFSYVRQIAQKAIEKWDIF